MTKKRFTSILIIGALLATLLGCSNETANVVDPTTGEPLLEISATTIDFGLNGLSRYLTITNGGGDTLSWSFTSYPAWIIPSSDAGVIPYNGSELVGLDLDRTALEGGTFQEQIELTSNAGDTVITVMATQVTIPLLGELPDTLDFGSSIDQLELYLNNVGQDTLHWSATIDDTTYFTVLPDTGATTVQTPLWVTFDRDQAPPAEFFAALTITTPSESRIIILHADNSQLVGQWDSHFTYATGYWAARPQDYYYIVLFNRPAGWESMAVDSIRACFRTVTNVLDDIIWVCFDTTTDQVNNIIPDITSVLYSTPYTNPFDGWNQWAVNWPLAQETFAIGYFQLNATPYAYPQPYYDGSLWGDYSFLVFEDASGVLWMEPVAAWEWCIEIYVRQTGFSTTTNHDGQWIEPVIQTLEGPPYRVYSTDLHSRRHYN